MVTTTTTNCDRCGAECTHGMTRVSASTTHWTKQREEVGEDYYQPAELCLTCGAVAAEVLGMTIRNSEKYDRGEMVRVAPAGSPIALGGGLEMRRIEARDSVQVMDTRAHP